MHTSWAVSRLLRAGFSSVPIRKGVSTVVWQPLGAAASGAMPSSTAWLRAVAARKSGAKKVEVRILGVAGLVAVRDVLTHKCVSESRIELLVTGRWNNY
jgi:hypothetical protein